MVLVNTLTVEAINTALIALQRGQSIVVGGEKGTTVNNITISNSGGGGSSGGSGLDFTPQISALDQRVGLLEKAEEVLRQENERQNERLDALEGLGIVDLTFEEDERNLAIELANGEVFETTITSENFSMEVVNGNLIITFGDQTHTVALPQGTQADWTQTDPDDPSFIKNKIPIWITQGSADDNMSPIDSVTDGSMRPVTSNAVARAINNAGQSYSLILGRTITSTATVYGTYNSRKLSDYRYLMFTMGVGNSIRATCYIDRGIFAQYGELYLTAPHGSGYSQISGIIFRYNDDTSIKMNTDGSGALNYVQVIGIT